MAFVVNQRIGMLARSAFAGLLALCSLAACKTDDGKASGDPIVEPPRGPVAAPDPRDAAYSPPAPSGDVIGHLRIADPLGLVGKISAQLAPAGKAGEITVDALRNAALSGAKSPVGKAIALHFDPGRVAACAVLDPRTHAIPLACVFGFERGFEQLVEDLGPDRRQPQNSSGGDPAAARYDVDGVSVYAYGLGPDVVIVFDDTAFAASRDYLEALSGRGGEWDVEVTLHARASVDRLRPAIDAAAADLVGRARSLAEDPLALALARAAAPSLAVLAPIAAEDGEAVLAELVEAGDQLDRLEVGARLSDAGAAIGVRATPAPGTALAAALRTGDGLPLELLDAVPRHTWIVLLGRVGGADVLPRTRAFAMRTVGSLLADLVGLPPRTFGDALSGLEPRDGESYADGRALACFNGPGTWGGAVLLRSLRPGVSGREAWRTFAATASPEAVLGAEASAELAKIVRWRFSRDAFAIDGIPVDRFLLEPAPRFEKKLAASLRDDDLAREIVAWVAAKPALLGIDRFETGSAAAFVLAPGGSEAYARRVVAAQSGEARAAHEELDALASEAGQARFLLGFSVADFLSFLREALPPDLLVGLPESAGHGLGDVALVGGLDPSGTYRLDLHVGQAAIDLVRRRSGQ